MLTCTRWTKFDPATLAAYWDHCAALDLELFGSTYNTAQRRAVWETMTVPQLNAERGDAWRTNDGEAHTLARSYLALRGDAAA